jgi:hypothetical protein
MDQLKKNLGASNPQSHLKIWMFGVLPVVGFLLGVAGHLFIR